MHTSSEGRQLIESFEGCILGAYDDANDRIVNTGDHCHGTLTIGFGHTTVAGSPTVYVGQRITKEEADQILSSDLIKVEEQVTNLVKVPLNQNQFDALVSFQFNTGALAHSSSLSLLNNGDYSDAADHLLLYDMDHEVSNYPIPGLLRRREAERDLFNKPITQTSETKPNDLLSRILSFLIALWRSWLLRGQSGNLASSS